MNIDRFLAAYEGYRETVIGMKKAARRRESCEIRSLDKDVMRDIMDYDELEREYEKKRRILSHATRKLQRAISKIRDPRESNYLICKYLEGMTNEEYAECYSYCERQVYRIASSAKKKLYRYLILEMPRAKRWKTGKRFSVSTKKHKTSLRKYGPKARAKRRKM